jgi:hypothetical protein
MRLNRPSPCTRAVVVGYCGHAGLPRGARARVDREWAPRPDRGDPSPSAASRLRAKMASVTKITTPAVLRTRPVGELLPTQCAHDTCEVIHQYRLTPRSLIPSSRTAIASRSSTPPVTSSRSPRSGAGACELPARCVTKIAVGQPVRARFPHRAPRHHLPITLCRGPRPGLAGTGHTRCIALRRRQV